MAEPELDPDSTMSIYNGGSLQNEMSSYLLFIPISVRSIRLEEQAGPVESKQDACERI